MDSGSSFNAISPKLAQQLNVEVKQCPEPLSVKIGNNQRITIPRKEAFLIVNIEGFPEYESSMYVMPIPEDKDALLGWPWLEQVNPDIDWRSRTISFRSDTQLSTVSFRQCLRHAPARKVGRQRLRNGRYTHEDDALQYFYMHHDFDSAQGSTRVVAAKDLKKLLREEDNEFCFVVQHDPDSAKADRQLAQDWDALRGHPAESLLLKYKDVVFRTQLPTVPPTRNEDIKAEIELVDDEPVARKQFRLSEEMKAAIREWTTEMLRAGIIRHSKSPYSAPTFCVKKAVGWRVVHDFRGINSKIRLPATPVPRKEDIFDSMRKGKMFSAMDLLWGFFQVRLRKQDVPYTAFSTPDGLFEYLVAPMGLSCSPAAFNRLIQRVVADQSSFCKAYFDDLFVYTETSDMEDHLAALEKVLERCKEEQLYVKLSKCTFCASEIPCLGDFIGIHGIRMDPDKVGVIQNWPKPRTKRELQSFLGTCVYVLKYCPDFAEYSAPLTELTKGKTRNEQLQFSEPQSKCFEELKRRLSKPPVLAHPDFDRMFCVKMDASDFAVGGYLYQLDDEGNERVIAYGGRKLSEAELKYPTREKELLAALFAMRTWHVYLIDKPFMISTDHRTLETILQQKTCSQRLARWLNELGMYQPLFKWIKGDSNVVADFISRNPGWKQDTTAISLAALLKHIGADNENNGVSTHLYASQHRGPSRNIQEQCSELYQGDGCFGPIVKQLQAKVNSEVALPDAELPKSANIDHYELQDSLLFFRSHPSQDWRLCVPDNRELRHRILFEEHDSIVRGHPGSSKTLKFMQQKYYWPSMARDIRSYCATCEMCMRTKTSRSKAQGLLHPLEVPDGRWKHITMDFVTSLPETKPHRHNAVMVIVDRLTKRAHFIATKSTATAQDTAKLFRDNFQRLHGLPVSIVCDRDSKFTSKFWTKLLDLQDTKLQPSSAFKPSTDGQTEITNRFLGDFLRAYVNPHQTDWNEFLALAEFAYNSRVHDSIGMAPFVADLGYLPRSVSDLAVPPRDGPRSASRFVDTQQTILTECQDALDQAQQRMKFYYDRNRPTTSFRVGDQVLLDTSNLALHHVGNDGKRSLAPKYIGPYPILKITTPDTYKLGLPPGLKLHDEFHLSRLRRYTPDDLTTRDNRVPALITSDGSLGLQVKEVLKHRVRRGADEYFIRWYGSANQDSWEPAESLTQVRGLIDAFHTRAKSSRPRTRSQAAQATATPLS